MRKLIFSILIIISNNAKVKAPSFSNEFIDNRFLMEVNKLEAKLQEQKRINSILKTIRIIETNENYHLIGKSGEYGAYQFTPSTWKGYCHMFFNKNLDIFIPENQDKVAEAKIKMLVEKGLTDEEIASFWNSGSKYWKGRKGVNKFGVEYNTPKYVKQFIIIKNNLS